MNDTVNGSTPNFVFGVIFTLEMISNEYFSSLFFQYKDKG